MVCSDPCRFLLPRAPKAKSTVQSNQGANSCWAVTSQFAVFKKEGDQGSGGGEKHYLSATAPARAETISYLPLWRAKGQRGKRTTVLEIHLWVCFEF